MRLPSVTIALRHARETLARFPLAILSGLGAMVVMLVMIEGSDAEWQPRLLTTFVLGLALFTASVTTAERRPLGMAAKLGVTVIIAVGLLLLYLVSLDWSEQLAFLRLTQLLIAAHLLVAVAPYLSRGGSRGFWQYNRFLLLRYLIASFYAVVLWIGLAVALGALDKLFGVDVPGKAYAQLWAVLSFGFHPWFFLSGVPRDYQALEELQDYPPGLKVFTQFVLMPLVVVYLAILTAYLGKVVITRTWPSGWIGYLVSSVSLTGVLALLLVHPIRERADSRWVNGYGRWWFVALLPALIMLLLAIGKRVGQYGVTEPRYFLLLLALWMLSLALFYGVTGSRNIKLLPMTLCAVALFSAAGPWSAYAVAERSQVARFNRILAANGMGRAGDITRPAEPVSTADQVELSAILRYLGDTHGEGVVARVAGVGVDSVRAWKLGGSGAESDLIAGRIMRRVGLAYIGRWEARQGERSFWANLIVTPPLDVRGFELVRVLSYPTLGWIGTASDSVELVRPDSSGPIQVRHGGVTVLELDLDHAVHAAIPRDSSLANGLRLAAPVIVEGFAIPIRVRLVLESFGGALVGDTIQLRHGQGYLLVGGLR